MVRDAFDVATMASSVTAPVGCRSADGVILRFPVGETVRSDQVQHVFRAESHRSRFLATLFKLVCFYGFLSVKIERDVERTGLSLGTDLQIDKQVVGALDSGHALKLDVFPLQGDICFADALAMDEQLQGVVFHADPPERRLDPVDSLSRC